VAFFISSSTVSLAQQHVVPDMIDHKSLLQLSVNNYYLIISFILYSDINRLDKILYELL